IYLLLDQYPLLTKSMIATLSEAIALGKGCTNEDGAADFGGMNVVLFGDLLGFPPFTMKYDALQKSTDAGARSAVGGSLFRRFRTVSTLLDHGRRAPAWAGLLERVRTGHCIPGDLDFLRNLVLAEHNAPDFTSNPWATATLVTARNSVAMAWNTCALRAYCTASGSALFILPAYDVAGAHYSPLTNAERIAIRQAPTRLTGLLGTLEIAVGMRLIATHGGCSSFGHIVSITLDAREP
ncbi:hypothetical protein B0H11DRAFT_1638582, partial [Mycena galericulata]